MKVLLTTHCARPSLIGPLELADMVIHISQSVSVLNITPYGNINRINLYDNILINKYQVLTTCNGLTPLQLAYFNGEQGEAFTLCECETGKAKCGWRQINSGKV